MQAHINFLNKASAEHQSGQEMMLTVAKHEKVDIIQ